MILNEKKIAFVWDLDETLGYFVEFGMFWEALQRYSHESLTDEHFFKILDLYPEFLRPNIIKVLVLLKNKKKANKNVSVVLYTNNQGPKTWAQHIVAYFNHKLKFKLFDAIIPAYKVNGRRVSPCRTGHEKKYSDFLRCTNHPIGTRVCFIDDQEHDQMKNDNVHYIHVKKYEHDLTFDTMIERLKSSNIGAKLHFNTPAMADNIMGFLRDYDFTYTPKTQKQLAVDRIITKKLYQHLQQFYIESTGKSTTRRNKTKSKRRTFKIHH